MMGVLGDAAISLGLPCFPCNAEKQPIVSGGFHAATADAAELDLLFSAAGARMIGVPTGRASGWVVVDVDVKGGAGGDAWLRDNRHRIPVTRAHATRSGGTHLVFRAPAHVEIRNSNSRIARGVDVRGEGGYVIVPPSPGYEIADETPIVDMPDWLVEACRTPEAPPPQAYRRVSTHAGDGSPYGLAALDDECDRIVNAPFGQQELTLNAACLKVGALASGGELAPSFALARLLAAGRAMPSRQGDRAWSPREVENKVRRSFADGQKRPRSRPEGEEAPKRPNGQHHAPPDPDMPGQDPDNRECPGADEAAPDVFATLDLDALAKLPPPEWLVKGVVTAGGNAVLYGPYASLKSFAVLDMALCIAFGRPWQGRDVKRCGVIYAAGEGLAGFARRVAAWRKHHGLQDGTAPFRLLHVPINITDAEHVARLVRTAADAAEKDGFPVGLIVVDTMARAMVGADENSAQDMGRAVAALDDIRAGVKATLLSVHHTGKDSERGPRGSTALPGAVDTLIRVDRADLSVTLTVEKQKDDDEGEPIILEAQKVDLGVSVDGAPLTSLVLVEGTNPDMSGSVRLSGRRLAGDQQQALKILHDTLAERGEVGFAGAPPGVPSIPENWWRDRFYDRCKPGADQPTRQKAFRRAADALVGMQLVGVNKGRTWAA